MVALEALREALNVLDYEIDQVEECVSDNNSDIEDNYYLIADNDDGIAYNDDEIDKQQYRIKLLQKQCRYA